MCRFYVCYNTVSCGRYICSWDTYTAMPEHHLYIVKFSSSLHILFMQCLYVLLGFNLQSHMGSDCVSKQAFSKYAGFVQTFAQTTL